MWACVWLGGGIANSMLDHAFLEHCSRRQIPEQEEERRAVREQGYRQRYVEQYLGKDGRRDQGGARRQAGGDAISQRDDQTAEENRNRSEQCADRSDTLGGKQ